MQAGKAALLAFAASSIAAAPTEAQAGTHTHADSAPDLGIERAAIEQFQALDQRLQDIGWKLARANAPFCAQTYWASGLQLQDIASYGGPDIARAALGLERDFAVQTAAAGSPAANAGAFRRNREIARLGKIDPNAWEADERLDWRRLVRAHDHLDRVLARDRTISVTFADGESATLTAVPACATRFELAGDGDRAVADGARVVIGMGFSGFAMGEDMLAAAVAHEFAHNLLGHKARLDAEGRSNRAIRATEREADRLMPWLLANARYDPGAASVFLREYRPDSGAMLFIPGTHDRWQRRVDAVETELPLIASALSSHGTADWSARFAHAIPDPSPSEAVR